MVLQLFRPPIDTADLMDCKLGDVNDAISLEYEKYFCGVGTFTLEISPASIFADKIAVNTLIYSRDDKMCWVVKNIKTEHDKITVTGYDLNCLLLDRLTMPTDTGEAGTEDKDAVSGSTEYCVKHFVDYNLVSSEMAERNIPHFEIAENLDRGIANDTYLASKECLEDVIRTMCIRAKLGYRISLITNASNPGVSYFIFDVMEQCDCTADQAERNRVIFSEGFRNIGGIEREIGVTAEKNALWCDVGGLDGFVNSIDDEIPSDWERREEYASLSVTDPYNQQFVTDAARQELADKFATTDSLTVNAGNPLDYGTVYNVGDVVTVYDAKRTAQLNSVISAVTVKRTATEYTVKLTLGESKPKLLDSYARKSDMTAKTQREYPASKTTYSNKSTVKKYEILSDNSIALNGTTYTIEKDDTGLISKISDSSGNSLEPAKSGEITDIATHNAVLWAVAMARGIYGASAPTGDTMPHMNGIFGYFTPDTLGNVDSVWANSIDGYGDISLSSAQKYDNYVHFSANVSSYGVFECPHARVVYAIYKGTPLSSGWSYAIQVRGEPFLTAVDSTITLNVATGGRVVLNQNPDQWGAYAIGDVYLNENQFVGYYNGVQMGTLSKGYASDANGVYLNPNSSMAGYSCTPNDTDFIMLAFGSEKHTDAQIRENLEWLMSKYLGGD